MILKVASMYVLISILQSALAGPNISHVMDFNSIVKKNIDPKRCDLPTSVMASNDLCSINIQKICSPTSSILTQTKSIFQLTPLERKKLDGSEDKTDISIDLIRRSNTKVVAFFKNYSGISVDVSKQFESIRSNLEDTVRSRPEFEQESFNTKFQSDYRAATLKKIQTVKLVTAENLDKEEDRNVVDLFIAVCGFNGLVNNASYFSEYNKIIVCPGYILSLAPQKSLSGMTFVVAHELGHAIDPASYNPDLANVANPNFTLFAPYLSCLEESHFNDFKDSSFYLDYTLRRAEKIESCLNDAKFLAAHSKNEVALARSLAEQYRKIVFDGKRGDYFIKRGLGFPLHERKYQLADKVIMHTSELSADLIGVTVIGDILSKQPAAKNYELVANNLKIFCYEPNFTQKMINDSCLSVGKPSSPALQTDPGELEDGQHPSDHFRIKAFLSNPDVRKGLGCSEPPEVADTSSVCTLAGRPGQKINSRMQPVSVTR